MCIHSKWWFTQTLTHAVDRTQSKNLKSTPLQLHNSDFFFFYPRIVSFSLRLLPLLIFISFAFSTFLSLPQQYVYWNRRRKNRFHTQYMDNLEMGKNVELLFFPFVVSLLLNIFWRCIFACVPLSVVCIRVHGRKKCLDCFIYIVRLLGKKSEKRKISFCIGVHRCISGKGSFVFGREKNVFPFFTRLTHF